MKHATLLPKQAGFTLIELLVVVVIIGILSSIAFPAYLDNVRKTNRSTAQADLMELSIYMERHFTENNTYLGASIASSGVANTSAYTYTSPIPNLAITTYTLTAVPVVGSKQASDSCGTMTVSQTGAQSAAIASCWP